MYSTVYIYIYIYIYTYIIYIVQYIHICIHQSICFMEGEPVMLYGRSAASSARALGYHGFDNDNNNNATYCTL